MAEQVEIAPVANARDLNRFIDLPYSIYRQDPYWVAPLRIAVKELFDVKKHPFLQFATVQSFLALREGQVVGRVTAILDPNHNKFHNEEAGFFGFFESVDEQGVADALLGAARNWLRERGAKVIRGPVNPSLNYECGLLVDGFDSSPVVMMTYNPRYYAGLLEGAGLRKAKDLYAYYVATHGGNTEKIERVVRRVGNQMQIRAIRMKEFAQEVERVWEIYNAAWSRNWGFVPATREEFMAMGREMKMILDPEMVLLGEVEGRVVGFALALPDINEALKHAHGRLFPLGLLKILYHKRSVRLVRVLVMGVREEYRTAGVAAGFYGELFRRADRRGYEGAEMSWVLEDNVMMCRSIEALGGQRYKTYRIYEWN